VIVVDSSAVVAIFFGESASSVLRECLERHGDRIMSVASYVESGMVLCGRWKGERERAIQRLDRFLDTAGIVLVPIDATQAQLALRAFTRFGRGSGHPARLNFGDTFSYALARSRNAPLLFIGDDFHATDVTVAVDRPGPQRPLRIET
jgi:ribonuclease VapC